jgi:hypothetical protein
MSRDGFNEAAEAKERLERAMLDHMPAYRFEKASGLKGIAGNYKYPGGLNAVEFDDAWTWTFHQYGGGTAALPTALVKMGVPMPEIGLREEINAYLKRAPKELQDALRNVWDELVTLNPALKAVRVDKTDIGMVYDAINGAASGFNANDINYYFEADNSDEARRAYFQDPRRVRIEDETGARACWIASPETLDLICLKLEERTVRAAAIRRTGPEV